MGDPTEKQPQDDANTKRIKGALFEIVLLGGVATGCWLLGDHLQKNGYEMSGLFFTIIGACLFFATVPVLLAKLLPKRKRLIWFPSFILALILIFTMISTNHKIPPPPPPMFAFTLTYPGVRSTVLLTNRSLIITNAESVKLEYLPYIFIPITNTSEVSVRFGLCNFGAVALKSIEAWFSTPSVLNWKAGKDWLFAYNPAEIISTLTPGGPTTNEVRCAHYRFQAILTNQTAVLEPLHFKNVQAVTRTETPIPLPCEFSGQGENFPRQEIAFRLAFVLVRSDATNLTPIVREGWIGKGELHFEIPEQIASQM